MMTNREAIAQLKEINREAHIYSEAVDMAISALQAQDAPDINVGDMISRQDAIAEFSCCELTPDGGIDANYAIDFLKQLPSAEPEPCEDFVKVVRCEKCRYVHCDKEFDNYWCNRMSGAFMVEAEGFCKWGR